MDTSRTLKIQCLELWPWKLLKESMFLDRLVNVDSRGIAR